MLFGCAAVGWLSILFYNGIVTKSYSEIYMLFATSLWLIANFLWMDGNLIYINILLPNYGHMVRIVLRGSYLANR